MFGKNNNVKLAGTIKSISLITRFNKKLKRKMPTVKTVVVVPRGAKQDIINVIGKLSDNMNEFSVGDQVIIDGCIRSYNYEDKKGKHTLLYISPISTVKVHKLPSKTNCVQIEGNVCMVNKLKEIKDKQVLTLTIAIDRGKRASFVPCVFWNKHAKAVENIPINKRLIINGAFKSRTYINKQQEQKTTYEISVFSYEELKNE